MCACGTGDGAICSKNRKIVPYHGDSPNSRISARLQSPSPIMAPEYAQQRVSTCTATMLQDKLKKNVAHITGPLRAHDNEKHILIS